MLQTHSSFPLKPLTDPFPPPFILFPSRLPHSLCFHPPKSSRFLVRCSTVDSETLPKSAIQRIADKLRSLGFTEETLEPISAHDTKLSAGNIFVPLPKQLPKYRVGHTIDSSWSTPENPVPEPGTGRSIKRFHELRDEVEKQKLLGKKKREERAPTLAELSLPKEKLGRLNAIGIRLKKKLKVGKAGITEGIVNTIHEQWRRSEVVKIVCEDLCRLNMKRTHDLLERKTGGIVTWRSGSKIILYRGANYTFPYFSGEILKNETFQAAPSDSLSEDGGNSKTSTSSSITDEKPAPPTTTDKMAHPAIIRGVGVPDRVRFQLPGEAELAEDADHLLEGLGPRFSDWWGYDPLPIDADLLPAVVSGYRRPFRLLPYGIKPKLTNDEMTSLRRLSRPLPCHFALGRNRNLQGLAASMIKLWEKCEIAKIAVKRGVQNTNSELMAKELQWLTGGTLLSRDREFIVFYRGKDFLPFSVSSAIEQQRYVRLQKMKHQTYSNTSVTTPSEQNLEINESSLTSESQSTMERVAPEPRKLLSSETAIRKTSIKLSMALEKKAKAEKLLAQLGNEETLQQPEMDKEGITVEERYMLKKVGLKMKPFLLLGRRGVFDGTVENMHLHWKYRELVKLITNERSIKTVHTIARTLEAESGGILVAVERVNRSYAIIVYRGKNYKRPSRLRPETLLNKKEALKRSIEAQRRKSLKLHVLKLTENIEELKLKMEKEGEHGIQPAGCLKLDTETAPGCLSPAEDNACREKHEADKGGDHGIQVAGYLKFDTETDPGCLSHAEDNACWESKLEEEGDHGIQPAGCLKFDAEADPACQEESESVEALVKEDDASSSGGNSLDTSINSLKTIQPDKMPDVLSPYDGDRTNAEFKSSSKLVTQGTPAAMPMDMNAESESVEPVSRNDYRLDLKSSVRLDEKKPVPWLASKIVNQPGDIPAAGPLQLSNKERLLLRRQALKMKKRPVLAVGKSNIVTGVAKAIKEHFKKNSLAIVNVKGRAKGTSVQEIVFKLEQATGAVLVSREPSNIILYRGWEAEDKRQDGKQTANNVGKNGEARPSVAPELLAAIKIECGLK